MESLGLLSPRSWDLYTAVTCTLQSLNDLRPMPLTVHPSTSQEKGKIPRVVTHYSSFTGERQSKRETQTAVTITLIKFRPRFSLSNTIEDRR